MPSRSRGGGGGGGGPSAPFPGGRGPGGRLTSGQRPVTEGTRIAIDVQLARFKASDEEEIVFPADMSNHDRAVVHAECKKLGLKSKSYGKGDNRKVHVTKPKEFKPQDHEVRRRPSSPAGCVIEISAPTLNPRTQPPPHPAPTADLNRPRRSAGTASSRPSPRVHRGARRSFRAPSPVSTRARDRSRGIARVSLGRGRTRGRARAQARQARRLPQGAPAAEDETARERHPGAGGRRRRGSRAEDRVGPGSGGDSAKESGAPGGRVQGSDFGRGGA